MGLAPRAALQARAGSKQCTALTPARHAHVYKDSHEQQYAARPRGAEESSPPAAALHWVTNARPASYGVKSCTRPPPPTTPLLPLMGESSTWTQPSTSMRRSAPMRARHTATCPRALLRLQRHCQCLRALMHCISVLHLMQQDAQPARLHALHAITTTIAATTRQWPGPCMAIWPPGAGPAPV
jgi:hypothetical protein